jgi:hypothetical protein
MFNTYLADVRSYLPLFPPQVCSSALVHQDLSNTLRLSPALELEQLKLNICSTNESPTHGAPFEDPAGAAPRAQPPQLFLGGKTTRPPLFSSNIHIDITNVFQNNFPWPPCQENAE